ncbi:hypothetical protein GE061_009910 [Apolygus lucorum]|uniref:Uncharacterized protein n=1 Tax=Apolygus lucorum TaxID=248454 RepID=A0A6A4JEW9_APOLU|nr:hypothetical protein GE061_009910 [Apolygus lucorum]
MRLPRRCCNGNSRNGEIGLVGERRGTGLGVVDLAREVDATGDLRAMTVPPASPGPLSDDCDWEEVLGVIGGLTLVGGKETTIPAASGSAVSKPNALLSSCMLFLAYRSTQLP